MPLSSFESFDPGSSAFRVLGPAPAPLSRLKGEHRVQFFLKGANRGVMRRALQAALAARPETARRITVDVDPVSCSLTLSEFRIQEPEFRIHCLPVRKHSDS